jgi:hypothetical protein
VTLDLSFSSVELRRANADERPIAFDHASPAAAGQHIQDG